MSAPQTTGSPFQLDVDRQPEGTVIHLRGAVTLGFAESFTEVLHAAVSTATAPIVLELADLTFINSAGLGALVETHLWCHDKGRVVRVVSPPPAIEQLLALTHLNELFDVHASVADALRTDRPTGPSGDA
ncbi:MAG: STAS domain-containing protein [Phycisphaerae bacterium]|nr:STAS domain-containing protein [Phycisphaerae bacterium]